MIPVPGPFKPTKMPGSELTGVSRIRVLGKTPSLPAAIASTLACSEPEVSYSPMDMNTVDVNITQEPDVAACQKRCEQTEGCAHFSYWEARGDCHLENIYAIATYTRIGFIAGPPSCVKKSGEGFDTVISTLQQQTCFEPDTQYTPVEGAGHVPHPASTVLECQTSCQQYSWCEHFSFNGLTYTCSLQTADAIPVRYQMTMTAGPKRCQGQLWLQFHAGLDWKTVASGTDLRQKFEAAVRYSIAESSPLIEERNVAVISDRASYGLNVQVVVASPQNISTTKIAEEMNSNLNGLRASIIKEVSSIKGISGHAVNIVNTQTLSHGQIIQLTGDTVTDINIERFTPAFVSRPFQGIGSEESAASTANINPSFNLAVKAQTPRKALRVVTSPSGGGGGSTTAASMPVIATLAPRAMVLGAAVAIALLLYTRLSSCVACRRRATTRSELTLRMAGVKALRTSSRDSIGGTSPYTSLEVLRSDRPAPDRQVLLDDDS